MGKKKVKRGAIFLSALLALCLFGCSGGGGSAVALNYATGMQDGLYDSELFVKNELVTFGADPGVIYVDPSESAAYGGYYYLYTTGSTANYMGVNYNIGYLPPEYGEKGIVGAAIQCYRSRDLSSWQLAGSMIGGFCVECKATDWENWKYSGDVWAPEVIYDKASGKYYMYYNMRASSDSAARYANEFYIGVAVSDTPVGPFRSVGNTDAQTGKAKPPVDFSEGLGLNKHLPVIDASPFRDPKDGKLYLHFKTEQGNEINGISAIYGMEMRDHVTPDYDTLQLLVVPFAASVSTDAGAMAAITLQGKQTQGTVNDAASHEIIEAPQVLYENGKYYMTYSANGYLDPDYSVWQAVGDTPLGPFVKVSEAEGNPIISGAHLSYGNGAGHHGFVRSGNECFAVYHVHGNEVDMLTSPGRFIFTDRVLFTDGKIVVNGPSKTLQPLPASTGAFTNIAPQAKVSVSGGSGKEYIADGLVPYYAYNEKRVFSANGDATVTFTFDTAVSVKAILIYNAQSVYNAFSQIARIEFDLAEKAAFMSKAYDKAVITDLKYPAAYLSETDEYEYTECAPAVARFDEIKVTKITVKLKSGDKLIKEDKSGKENTTVHISEIMILGGI
ncbi:MAG: family 43 glycosylhydrolase [Clostridiales bacterium]|nr:family 43 glycosylhydrolase [Clostridiales bacterium]